MKSERELYQRSPKEMRDLASEICLRAARAAPTVGQAQAFKRAAAAISHIALTEGLPLIVRGPLPQRAAGGRFAKS